MLQDGHRVVGLDNRNDAYDVALKDWRLNRLRTFPEFQFFERNIASRDVLTDFISQKFDAVIHLAARAGVRYSIQDPWEYVDTNVTGTLNILDFGARAGVKKIVLASSSSVYGNSSEPVFSEFQRTDQPVSPYAATKKAVEALAYSYHHLYALDVSILRFFTVYGPAGRPDMSILRFVHAIEEGKTFRLYGDGTQQRDFTYCEDIADGVIRALRPLAEGFDTFNLGGDRPHSMNFLIDTISRLSGRAPQIERRPVHIADVANTRADIRHAREILGWEPRVSLEDGIARTLAWYRENRDWVRNLKTLGGE